MRDIKLKAYDTKKKLFTNYQIKDDMIYCIDKVTGVWIRVKDESRFKIMQYTGLKDKNGVEIYEGDIVLTKDGRKAIIEYSDVYASYFLDYIGWCDNDFLFDTMELEVIGNVYDNPELLEEESD